MAAPNLSTPAHNAPPSDSISEHDLSLTSPPKSRSPRRSEMNPPGHDVQNPIHHDPGPAPGRRALAPKPHGVVGSINNPISMLEDSPPKKSAHAPTLLTKRKYHNVQQSEPHKFVDKGYRKLYSYRQSRPAMVPQPANGTTFTGHKNQDVYRAMNAKVSAAAGTKSGKVSRPIQQVVPFEVQFPMSTRFLANRAIQNPVFSSFVQQHGVHIPVPLYASAPDQTEELLRRKAVQFVREYSRPTLRKRALSNADPDETSTSESEELTVGLYKTSRASMPHLEIASATPRLIGASTPKLTVTTPKLSSTPQLASASKHTSTPNFLPTSTPDWATAPTATSTALSIRQKSKLPVFRDTTQNPQTTQAHAPNNTIETTHLTEHTALLTSLLKLYPSSRDKKGLREDIAMLLSVQNQRLEAWLKSETELSRSMKKTGHTISSEGGGNEKVVSAYTGRSALVRMRKKMEPGALEKGRERGKDERVRGLLSAGAGMWQDGSGVGVVDVFAGERGEGESGDEVLGGDDGGRPALKDGGGDEQSLVQRGDDVTLAEGPSGRADDADMPDVA
ncbi:hypothetical protein T440DRAFT_519479 [Plenodomus tracheiphilus IPT5]|uniref:Uncharacterized protein n=1 Tax=Plenodomus tracheiphilus IPT5 TaxID=1408161 RepID=A0A6A7B4I5_9PLEO|nr:hypothetical protein T440DRAFT_519479 [Plenodomus tracheiphilus IPT5]